MRGSRPNTIRRRTVALCVVLGVALAGCADRPAPPREGGAAQSRAEKARKDAEAEAEDDALAQARDLVEQKLAALDPPVRHRPSAGEVRAEFVRKDSRTVRAPDADERAAFAQYGVSGNLVYVEYDVEVTADQVR